MLFVDDRQGSSELIPLLGLLAVETRLESGDVVWSGQGPDGDLLIGVEVKKIGDLLSSETTGRLAATQIPRMLNRYQQVWLLTVGEYRAGRSGRLEIRGSHGGWYPYRIGPRPVPYGYLEAFLVEIQVLGVHIKQVYDNRAAAQWLVCAHNWWQKPWEKHRAMRKLDRSGEQALMPGMDGNTEQMVKLAAQLPNIGWERAWAAAQCFAHPHAMFSSSAHQWEEVPGVGKVIAKSVIGAIYNG